MIADNPNTVFWSLVLTTGVALIVGGRKIWVHYFKKKADTKSDLLKAIEDGELAIRKKRNETECNVLETVAQTACKMMEQATAVAPELKALKAEVISHRKCHMDCMWLYEGGSSQSYRCRQWHW